MKLSSAVLALLPLLCFANEALGSGPVVSGSSSSHLDSVYKVNPDDLLKQAAASAASDSQGSSTESFTFQTEVTRVMHMIINSLYKSKEIFLRELISNASDALDKMRFLSLTDTKSLGNAQNFNITIVADKENRLLNIRDTGVGMTKKDLIANLGTIAKSGTAEFLEKVKEASGDSSNLIGQFGVGFYSAYLVADKVTVISKHNDDEQYIWTSAADSNFSIARDPRGNTLGRGTMITLHMKEDSVDYLDDAKLKDLIKRYSEFINFPIYLYTTKTVKEEVEDETEAEAEPAADEDEDSVIDGPTETKARKKKTVEKVETGFERINDQKPIWSRDPKEVAKEEYTAFYRAIEKQKSDPMTYLHFKAEGDFDFRSIIFVPEKNDQSLLTNQVDTVLKNFKLFVRRVFITDELGDFIPRYLSFVKGVIDSDDLPLNVSREQLQKSKMLALIKKKVIQKIFEMIADIAENDAEKYVSFYKEYGTNLKLGLVSDNKNKDKISKLLRFYTSSSPDELVSLDEYISRMKKGQKHIYCLTGATMDEIKKSPFVEKLIGRGFEVVYMSDPIDEYVLQALYEYEKKPLQNVAKDGLKFGDEDETSLTEVTERFKPLTDWLSDILKEKLEKVVITNRLVKSPAAIVASSMGLSGNMEKIMNAQAYGNKNDPMRNFYLTQKKIMEVNPAHPLIEALLDKSIKSPEDETVRELATILYETSMLRSSYELEDSAAYAKRVETMLRVSLGVDLNAEPQVDLKPAEEADGTEEEEENASADSATEEPQAHEEL